MTIIEFKILKDWKKEGTELKLVEADYTVKSGMVISCTEITTEIDGIPFEMTEVTILGSESVYTKEKANTLWNLLGGSNSKQDNEAIIYFLKEQISSLKKQNDELFTHFKQKYLDMRR